MKKQDLKEIVTLYDEFFNLELLKGQCIADFFISNQAMIKIFLKSQQSKKLTDSEDE